MSEPLNVDIPDTLGAAALISYNNIRNGSRCGVDGYIYDLLTGERVNKYFLGGRVHRNARIWAGYTDEHLSDLERRMFEIQRRADEFWGGAFPEIMALCERKGPRPCTTPDEGGAFRRFSPTQFGRQKTFGFSWFTTGEDTWCERGRPTRMKDGDRIAHLEARGDEWWRRARLFSGEIDAMFVKLCLDRFGVDGLEHTTRIDMNGRSYYYGMCHTGLVTSWRRLIWPVDGLNEVSL